MRQYNFQTPVGKKAWRHYLLRQTGTSDPLYVRHDPLTVKVFGGPCSARDAVAKILRAVQQEGDKALCRYTRLIEGYRATPQALVITARERSKAEKQVPPSLKQALKETASHIRAFHQSQREKTAASAKRVGVTVTERRLPLDRVGIYVPGGNAPLVSTVLMNALPAKIAGVKEMIMATPPDRKGQVLPAVIYAAGLAGVDRIYRLGGAAAIAAMAFGTQSIAPVDKIVGPANIFGTEAKRQVVGHVGIDSLAGPSEILIIADETAVPEYIAWDLLGQGEHGSGSVAIVLSDSKRLLAQVEDAYGAIVEKQPEFKEVGKSTAAFYVKTMAEVVKLANAYAPEHLSLQVRKPRRLLSGISRAGAAFLGSMTAQAMGDYTAGSNHVLPTSQTARWSSPLSVRDFMRYTSVIEYSHIGMRREAAAAIAVAEVEGLHAHANSIRQRLSQKRKV